jgi:hypothetical protein
MPGWKTLGRLAAAAVMAMVLVVMVSPARAAEIGEIKTLRGRGSVLRADGALPMAVGMGIHLDDDLRTEADSAVGISLADGTVLSLGANGHLTVDTFLYDPGAGDVGLALSFLNGTLAYLSGRIAHVAPENVSVTTPVGVVGIRGTRFVLKVSGD